MARLKVSHGYCQFIFHRSLKPEVGMYPLERCFPGFMIFGKQKWCQSATSLMSLIRAVNIKLSITGPQKRLKWSTYVMDLITIMGARNQGFLMCLDPNLKQNFGRIQNGIIYRHRWSRSRKHRCLLSLQKVEGPRRYVSDSFFPASSEIYKLSI